MIDLRVKFSSGAECNLTVEEFHPVDLSAHQYEAGWTAYSDDGTEYFVSTYGVVWEQPDNEEVGIAPVVKAAADEQERVIAEAMGNE